MKRSFWANAVTLLLLATFALSSCGGATSPSETSSEPISETVSDTSSGTSDTTNTSSEETSESEKTLWERYWADDNAYGMQVTEDGTLTLAGEAYYGFGMNYYSMFTSTYGATTKGFSTTTAKKGIDQLAENDVQVVRINCGGYGASNSGDSAAYNWVNRYLTDTDAYMSALTELVDYCASKQIGLILSLFWKVTSIPYNFGEQCSDLGDTTSKSYQFVRDYTTAIVTAFKDNKAIMGWEIGNEWNLETDLNVIASVEEFHVMSQQDYITCANAFDEIVTSIDTHGRFISSGNAVQRTTQYNQAKGNAQRDTWEEHVQAMADFHPNNFNMVSDHVYDYPSQRDYKLTLNDYLSQSMSAAKGMGKVYFLGEFCLNITGKYPVWDIETGQNSSQMMTLEWTMENMENACNVIIANRVQLTLFWNFDPSDITESSFCLSNVQGTVTGSSHAKFGKFLFALCKKLNTENYPNSLKNA